MSLRSTARLSAKLLRTRFWDQRPFILSHLITARCNADCVTCLWKMPASSRADELDAAEVAALYSEAARAGFGGLVLWGGEPMLRPDVGQALAHACACGLDTTMITNGYFLHERGHEVLPHLRRLLVSVDAVGDAHDRIRQCRGLFERLDRGLALAREQYPALTVVLMTVLSRQNVGELASVAAYAKEHSVRVVFQAMNFTDYGFGDRAPDDETVVLSADQEASAAAQIHELSARGFPVYDSRAYLARLGHGANSYRCHYKKVALRVEPNGDVLDCTAVAQKMFNVRELALSDALDRASFRDFQRRAEACNRCRDTGVIEASHMWEGRLGAIVNAVRGLR